MDQTGEMVTADPGVMVVKDPRKDSSQEGKDLDPIPLKGNGVNVDLIPQQIDPTEGRIIFSFSLNIFI